ncbi:MAG TPA: OmpH family outer membrane protein [Alphaproteobacteria bacterium]|nr:OmpH family outer membrane protein [Alphaproteobacteria bacterium]
MRKAIITLGFAALVLAQLGGATLASAQAKRSPTPAIAIVDVQAIMQNSEAAKSIRTQIEKVRNSYQQTIHGKEEELRKLDQDLEQQRSVLSSDAFQQRQRDFQQKVSEAQKDVQERSRKLEAAFGSAMEQVQHAVLQIVQQIAKEQNITLVLQRAGVVYAPEDMDITQEVLKRLNSRLPSVNVTIPK